MQLTWTGFRFELPASEYAKAKLLGWHWDFRKKICWTGVISIARQYQHVADSKAKERFKREDTQVALSMATDSNMVIIAPKGLEYLPFQKAGISFALPRHDTLIADEMRLGKTVQACGVINADPTIKSVLVICPAFLKINWSRELQKWVVRKMSGGFATSKELPDTEIVLANYEIIKKLRPLIDKRSWDLVIMDESHFLKNPDSQRTRAVLGWESQTGKTTIQPIQARRRIALTGTPILNRPVELWPICRVFDPEGLGASHWAFVKKFCKAWEAPWGWDFSGASNLDELQTRLRSSFMIRRTKEQVLPELPPIRRQIIPIPAEEAKQVIQAEKEFFEKNEAAILEAAEMAKSAQVLGDTESYKAAVGQLKAAKKATFDQLSILRHQTARAKVPYVIQYLEDCLENEKKVVCFGHHIDVIEGIANHFKDVAVKHHGGLTMAQKQESVDRFNQDEKCRLFVGGITLAIGYSLAVASLVVMAELDWVPGNMDQAEKRLDAIDQKMSILVQHICFDGSVDISMAKRIIEKQTVIKQSIG